MVDPFSTKQPLPPSIIDSRGQYTAGWFEQWDRPPNIEASAAPSRRLQFWFHLHCESSTHYFSANVAQMGRVGNVSLVVIDKQSGQCEHFSEKRWLWRNQIKQTGGCALIWDPVSGSSVSQNHRGDIAFRFNTSGASFHGTAEPAMGPPFVQSTSLPQGYGSLQWWGPLHLCEGHFETQSKSIEIPKGSIGGFDRTIGHRYRKQRWNWLCAQGEAESPELARIPFALQFAVDRLRPKELPDPKKMNLWMFNRLFKFDTVTFKEGGSWDITGSGSSDAESIHLSFHPVWTRQEKSGHTSILGGDFKQLFGPLRGRLVFAGIPYQIDVPFALLEDSYLNL